MKKIKILASIMAFTVLFFSAKPAICQTTQEEYNYVTKGYKTQLESGLDMKKGYTLKALTSATSGVRSVTLQGLYRTSTNVLCAIIIIYTKSGNATEYLCAPMPGSSEVIYNQYFESLYDESKNINANARP